MNSIWKIGCLILLFFPVFSTGQSPYFRQHNLDEEYPNVKTNKIYQGDSRQVWLASSDGLIFYDGIQFVQVHQPSHSNSNLWSIYETPDELLWLGYENGQVFLGNRGTFSFWSPPGFNPDSSSITHILGDKEGRIWISTYGSGMYLYSEQELIQFELEDGLLGEEIYGFILDHDGKAWCATDGGISVCSYAEDRKLVENISREDGLPDDIVRTLTLDHDNNIWIGMYDNGVCKYDVSTDQITKFPEAWDHGVVRTIEEVEDREIWIGTEGDGVWRYCFSNNTLQKIEGPDGIDKSKVFQIMKDLEGNIWMVNNVHGLLSSNRQFEHFQTPGENLQAVLVDQRNDLWIGSGSGLFIHNNEADLFNPILEGLNLNVLSLYEDFYGNIWAGTFGDGVYCYHPESNNWLHLDEENGLANGSILSIAGSEGSVWLATLGGVSEVNVGQDIFTRENPVFRNYDYESGLGTNFVYYTYIDSKGKAWFATDGQGLCVLNNGKIYCYEETIIDDDTISFSKVYSITEDLEGNIWFSTPKSGIFKFDGKDFEFLDRKEGIRDLEITGLVRDNNGNIVIIHPSGIDLLDPASHHLIYFDSEVGIEDFDPNLNAFTSDEVGDIWIADTDELIRYSPLNEDLVIHPETRLNQVFVSLEEVDLSVQNSFRYDQNQFIFSYSGLWYTDPQVVRYRYQLEGFDSDWIKSRDNSVTYSNLPPGSYTFHVSSTENDAFDNEPISSYSFKIRFPIWSRWWFVLLAIIATWIVIYNALKLRDQRKQRINNLQRERVTSQLEAIKSQINPHFLFNSFNTLIAIIEESPDVAVEYVEYLSDFYRSLLQYRQEEVISLDEELKIIENYHYLLKKRYGENLQIQINRNGSGIFLAPLTLQMLVENAVKHNVISQAKPLNILINAGSDFVEVRNNLQPKFRAGDSTGFGLSTINQRYEILSGKKIEIEQSDEYFSVKVPVLKN